MCLILRIYDLVNIILYKYFAVDRLYGIVVSTSDCHPRGPRFDSQLYPSVIVLCGSMMMKGRGESETRCRLIACSSRKAPRGPPGLTSPSDGRIAINSIICLLNIHTAEGFGI